MPTPRRRASHPDCRCLPIQIAALQLTPHLLTEAIECTFDVEQLAELQAWQFDEAVRYLVSFGSRL